MNGTNESLLPTTILLALRKSPNPCAINDQKKKEQIELLCDDIILFVFNDSFLFYFPSAFLNRPLNT